ncbi:MAG: HupE/UreJ family protein, partial [Acidobacteria bacterium]|nr:HupE/UreJ family protein [Acidobacteriota bacterium]
LRRLAGPPGLEAVLRLSGEVPAGARTFTWAYSLSAAPYALTLRDEREDTVATQWLEGEASSEPFPLEGAAPSRLAVARQYLVLGFTHILPKGLDHILFVLGLCLLCTRLRPLLVQVTTFTFAHTISLGLSTYGIVSLPSSVVEPLIALSIVYVAAENVLSPELSRWRVLLVFVFGLLHGLGFAGVLGELGLPRSAFVTALATFNVGVELGQLAVITLAFLLLASWSRHRAWYRQRIVVPVSLLIAAVGLFWTLQRVLA